MMVPYIPTSSALTSMPLLLPCYPLRRSGPGLSRSRWESDLTGRHASHGSTAPKEVEPELVIFGRTDVSAEHLAFAAGAHAIECESMRTDDRGYRQARRADGLQVSARAGSKLVFEWCPRQDLNLCSWLRRPVLYPG